MGNCASFQYTKSIGGSLKWPSSAQIVHIDGRLQEFRQPTKASHVLSQNPNCFLCNSESMYIDCHVPQVPEDEELQLGQIYFLMPLSKSHARLSLQELCVLASKASVALAQSDMGYMSEKTLPYPNRNVPKLLAGGHRRFNIRIGFEIVGMNFPVGRWGALNQLSTKILQLK